MLAAFAVVLTAIQYFGRRLERRRGAGTSFARQVLVLFVFNVGLVAAVLVLPLPAEATRLGDFSVSYRIAGFPGNPKELLSARSRLHTQMLDALQGAGVEIVSPTFMNQRQLDPVTPVLAQPRANARRSSDAAPSPEAVMFDKAERVSDLETLRAEQQALAGEIEDLETELRTATGGQQRQLNAALLERRARVDAVSRAIEELEASAQEPSDG